MCGRTKVNNKTQCDDENRLQEREKRSEKDLAVGGDEQLEWVVVSSGGSAGRATYGHAIKFQTNEFKNLRSVVESSHYYTPKKLLLLLVLLLLL